MFKYNLLIVLLCLAINFFIGSNAIPEPEPRDLGVERYGRGISANKKNNDHQLIVNHPNETEVTTNSGNSIGKESENSTVSENPGVMTSKDNANKINPLSSLSVPDHEKFEPVNLSKPDIPVGWGWDSEMARVAQVMVAMGFYLLAMFIKSLLISWGLGEIKRQLVDKITSGNGMDALVETVQNAISLVAQKYYG